MLKRTTHLQYRDAALRLNGAYQQHHRVSLCTTVKNRLEHLQQTVLKNLENNQNYLNLEIVILNYNCPNPDTEAWVKSQLSSFIDSGRISYYRYADSDSFERAHAKNLAFRLAKGELLCNVDADNLVGRGFADFISAHLNDGRSYLAGPRDGRGLAGRIAVRKTHFESVGGYDERVVDWGGGDMEFSARLDLLSLTKRPIYKSEHLHAIQHDDELRMQYSHYTDKWEAANLNTRYREQNISSQTINPNGTRFGCGRVQRNFGEWVEIGKLVASE